MRHAAGRSKFAGYCESDGELGDFANIRLVQVVLVASVIPESGTAESCTIVQSKIANPILSSQSHLACLQRPGRFERALNLKKENSHEADIPWDNGRRRNVWRISHFGEHV